MSEKKQRKHSQTEVRPKESEEETNVLGPNLHWCLQASQSALCSGQSSYMTRTSLHDRCGGAGSVQMCSYCKVGAPPRRTICPVTTALLRVFRGRYSRSVASAVLEARWLQAAEDWSVFMFTFQEERLGRLVCIGLKRLQHNWQTMGKKWQDTEPWSK